jgi:xylulokinase
MLDQAGAPVRPALLGNDTRCAAASAALTAELGPEHRARAVGSVPGGGVHGHKLRWLAEHQPAQAARVATVLLRHD